MKKDFDEEEAAGMAAKMGANATEADIQKVAENMDSTKKGPLVKVWDKVVQLWDAFKSPDTPKSLKAIIIGGLIYMVSPVDLVPDVIPVFGLLDDAGVIGIVFSQFVRLAGSMAIGAAIVTIIDKAAIKKRAKEALKATFQDEKFTDEFREVIKQHDKGMSLDDLESWEYDDGTVDFSAKVTSKTENEISMDILDSWDNVVVSDVQLKGEKVASDIKVGTEIVLTA